MQRESMSMPISCMPRYIATILDNYVVDVEDIEEIKNSMPATFNFKVSHGIKAYTNVVILNKLKEPVGFIEVQWFDKKKFNKNDHELLRLAAFIEENILNVDSKI